MTSAQGAAALAIGLLILAADVLLVILVFKLEDLLSVVTAGRKDALDAAIDIHQRLGAILEAASPPRALTQIEPRLSAEEWLARERSRQRP